MTKPNLALPLALLLSPLTVLPAQGQDTMGLLLKQPGAFPGYTLFGAFAGDRAYLVDLDGDKVHEWSGLAGGVGWGYLMDNGDLARVAQSGTSTFAAPAPGGKLQRVDWDGNLLWDFAYSDAAHHAHHDLEPMPNGNFLTIALERKSAAEAIAAGRDPTTISGEIYVDHIIEVQPTGPTSGTIVWEWHAWDHLVQDFDPTKPNFGPVDAHPELMDLNYTEGSIGSAWVVANAIAYNEDLDQVMISLVSLSEIWVIDHSTTTAEAAGHIGGARGRGGDLLYRWGNPQVYRGGTAADRNNYIQHEAVWIQDGLPGEGKILFFNNGNGRPDAQFSSAEEIVSTADSSGNYPLPLPGTAHGPEEPAAIFTTAPPESMFSGLISGAQRLPNGNTFMCEGQSGTFWEVDSVGTLVWKYVCPANQAGPMVQGSNPTGNLTFRATRYGLTDPAFAGRDLTPMGPIEIEPTSVVAAPGPRAFALLAQNAPNPFRSETVIRFHLERAAGVTLRVFDASGRLVRVLDRTEREAGAHAAAWNGRDAAGRPVPPGVYFYRLQADGRVASRKMVVLR